jgi:predicted phage terminase large subunit-like protein
MTALNHVRAFLIETIIRRIKMSGNRKQIIKGWIEFLEKWRPPALPEDAREFITRVLGYQFMPFHERWWEFAEKNGLSLILAPRGHGKSTILTMAFSLRRILNNPDLRLLIVSNTAAQAQSFLREIRHHLEINTRITDLYGDLAGHPWNESEINLASRLHGAKEATVTAMGVMGPVISKHYDITILDDVVDEEAARSKTMRRKMETWYYKELLPTLEPDGELHIIGTRYHHNDLYGRLIDAGIPVLIDKAINDNNGEESALWEEKFPLELLKKKRDEAGPAIFNAQYQNDVTAMKGAIFRPEWIEVREAPPCQRKYQGVDLAIGKEDHNDYFAHVTIGERGRGQYHVLSVYRARLSFEDQFRAVRTLFLRHDRPDSPVVSVGVEANAYQEAMAQRLRAETTLPVKSIIQTKDKIARAMRMQGLFQTGRITFPNSGTSDLIEELLAFPDSDHDDLVDALEMAMRMACEHARYSELPFRNFDPMPDN